MITAQELRIGNRVFYKTVDLDTGEDFLEEIVISANDIKTLENSTRQIFLPIPLTEEWLLKFGFEYREHLNDWFIPMGEKNLTILIWSRSGTRGCNPNEYALFFHHCEYVHQLQNLYFALTGEELKISNQ